MSLLYKMQAAKWQWLSSRGKTMTFEEWGAANGPMFPDEQAG